MTKLIKTLIVINGILFPLILIIITASLLIEQSRMRGRLKPDPVLTENFITQDGDTLIAQGLSYYTPESIYNSTDLLIKVKPKTYKIPKSIDKSTSDFEVGTYAMRMPLEYYVNVLFLDSNFNNIRRLVDRKASIESITIPTGNDSEEIDTTVKNIAYLIAFEDSNKDKLIDYDDNYDLYISDLKGGNLTRVTQDIDIKEFQFINNHQELFISFTEKGDLPEEHKIKRFAIYSIELKKLTILTNIDKALNDIQSILNN